MKLTHALRLIERTERLIRRVEDEPETLPEELRAVLSLSDEELVALAKS